MQMLNIQQQRSKGADTWAGSEFHQKKTLSRCHWSIFKTKTEKTRCCWINFEADLSFHKDKHILHMLLNQFKQTHLNEPKKTCAQDAALSRSVSETRKKRIFALSILRQFSEYWEVFPFRIQTDLILVCDADALCGHGFCQIGANECGCRKHSQTTIVPLSKMWANP